MRIWLIKIKGDINSDYDTWVTLNKNQISYEEFVDFITTKSYHFYDIIDSFKDEGCYFVTHISNDNKFIEIAFDLENLTGVEKLRNKSGWFSHSKIIDNILKIRSEIIIEEREIKLSQLV
jgi:hypothetical protein